MSSADNPGNVVYKLYTIIIEKKQKNDILSFSSPQTPEFKKLLDDCTDKNNHLAHACCQALITLVTQGHAEFKFVLDSLLNVTPTGRNLGALIQAVFSLLIVQMKLLLIDSSHEFKSPYGIRTNPHPFVTILTTRQELGPLILQVITQYPAHKDDRVRSNFLELMGPFLKFVLLDPTKKHKQLKTDIENFLIGLLNTADQEEDVFQKTWEFLINILPLMQMNGLEDLGHMSAFLHNILDVLMSLEPQMLDRRLTLFAERLLALCPDLLHHGIELGPTLHMLNLVTDSAPKALQESCVLSMATELLLQCPAHNLIDLLTFVESVLSTVYPSHMMAGMAMLPLLHIIANPGLSFHLKERQKIVKVAASCLQAVEGMMTDKEQNPLKYEKHTGHVTRRVEYCNHEHFAQIAFDFQRNETLACDWLRSIKSSSQSIKIISQNIVNLVASLFLNSTENDNLVDLAADVLVKIAASDPSKASSLLPVFLYKLKRTKRSEDRHSLLHRIPQLATHRSAVGAVLRFIQMLGMTPDLHPVSIRLLTELWKNQERCYSYLLKALLDDTSTAATCENRIETLTAKAAAIRDVCKLKPHQHGSELLALISKILNECTSDEEVLPSALAMESLKLLCAAEVIDAKTTWKVMAEKLTQDSRPLISVKICELFSVMPAQRQDAPDYEEFLSEIASFTLWCLSQSEVEMVQIAAYKALAAFKLEDFKFSHIPDKVRKDIKLPEPEEEGQEPTLPYIPAFCFSRLLADMSPTVVPAFREFLTSLVRQEVSNLPRGIHHSAMRRQNTLTPDGKAINSIPHLLQTKYEQVKNPGLRPGLAAGLLFCYDPPVEVGRDGRTRKHYLVQHGRNYEQFLKSLLHEVPLQASDWHRCVHLPEAWVTFMEGMYTSCLACRKAELEIQLRQDKISEEEANTKRDTAWLWLRDRITDSLKSASRGHVTQQANSLFALMGLTLAVNKFVSGMDSTTIKSHEEMSEYISLSHWSLQVVETMTSILDHKFQATTQVLPWGNTDSSGASINQASVLLRCSASVSLPLLVPIMITSDIDRLKHIIDTLALHLPGKQHIDDVPPALQFHAGLGLGMFISALQQEHFSEVGGTQGMVTIWKTIELLEVTSFDSGSEYRSGAVLGLGAALVSLCSDNRMDSQVHAMTTLDRMLAILETMDQEDKVFESLCRSVAVVTEAAYSANVVSGDIAQHVAEKLFQLHQKFKKVSGLSLALGLLCHGMQRVGHPMAEGIQKGLYATWMECLKNKEVDTTEKLSSISGLLALVGSERNAATQGTGSGCPVSIADLIRVLSESLSSGHDSDITLKERTAWLMGHFYQSSCSVVETRASVPVSYGYLPEASILRALIDDLQLMIKSGPECGINEHHCAVLGALADGPKHALPPLNWPGLLAPILRMSFDISAKYLALKIAIEQSIRVSTSAMFLSSWIVSPLFGNLHSDCHLLLYENLATIVKTTPVTKLQQFLENGCLAPFLLGAEAETGQSAVLKGLKASLMIPNPPQSVMGHLYTCLESIYGAITSELKPVVLEAFCDCLSEVPDEVVDRIIQLDVSSDPAFMKCVYIRCWLVGHGKQPIALLNPCIDASLRQPKCDYNALTWLLMKSFFQMSICEGEFAAAMNRLQWLLELLGHVRNTLQGTIEQGTDVTESLMFSIHVVAAAMIAWSTRSPAMTLALHHGTTYSLESGSLANLVVSEITNVAPGALMMMVDKEPWKQINNKVHDWLHTMYEIASDIKSQEIENIKGLIIATRNTEEAKRIGVWSRMAML